MTQVHLNPLALEEVVRRALLEDIGYADITTVSVVPEGLQATAVITLQENGVVCGHPVAEMVYRLLDPRIRYERLAEEAADVPAGTVVARLVGPARGILTGERVALNFLQRLSGMATTTRRLAERVKYYKAKLVPSRKTAPGLRLVDMYAVQAGGGGSHRFDLTDAVVIKGNHIAISGGVRQAITAARRAAPFTAKVEVEVRDLDGVEEALNSGADIILLDNMEPDQIKQAVDRIAGKAIVEAAGRVHPDNLEEVAKSGVDYISLGWLTHSCRALAISLDVVGTGEEATA